MLSTSELYQSVITQIERTWSIKLTVSLDSGDVLELSEKDLVQGSFTFKEGSTCTQTIQIGSTFANSVEFALLNDEQRFNVYNFNNAKVYIQIGLLVDEETFEYVPLGYFNIIKSGKKLSTIAISCMDDMYKANTSMPASYVVYPIPILQFVQLLCTYSKITLSNSLRTLFSNSGIVIPEFDHTEYSCRDLLAYAAILIGYNLRINRAGELEGFWYTNTGQQTTPATRVSVAEYEELDVNVSGVEFKDANENVYHMGDHEYVISFDVNPLITDEALSEEIVNMLYIKLHSMYYRPCIVYHMGDPSWQAGDIITHVTQDGTEIVAPLMTHTFKFRASATLSTLGTIKEQNRQLTSDATKLLETKIKQKKDLNEGLSAVQQTALRQSDLLTNSLGFYPKVEYNEDGSIKAYYLMSTPEDTPTTTVWAITSGGIGISHNGTAGPYSSSWTADDSIVASIITADMIKTGVLDTKVLNVNATRDVLGVEDLDAEVTELNVSLGEVEATVGTQGKDITVLKQTSGQVSVAVATEKGELTTIIDATTWEAKLVDVNGNVLSGLRFDFEKGQFIFDGSGNFTGSLNIGNNNFIVDVNGNVTAKGDTRIYGGKYYALQEDGQGGYTSMDSEGFAIYSDKGVQRIRIGFPQNSPNYPYVLLNSGTATDEPSGIMKKFADGIWFGNDAPANATGNFYPQDGYQGIFVSFADDKTYVVSGKNKQNIYTGEAIARFG